MIKDRLKDVRDKTGMNKKEFAEYIGIKYTTYNNYETGAREPDSEFLIMISKKFDVSTDFILGLQDDREILHSYELRSSEYEHVKKYRLLDDSGKERIDYELQKECERVEQIEKLKNQLIEEYSEEISPICSYPYLGKIACAGTGFYFDDIPTDIIKVPYMESADFIIGVSGDSMEPDYHSGEKLYVKKVEYLGNGDVGIFTIGNECFLKELGEDGLISRNKDYDDIPGDEKVRLIGKVIGKVVE